MSPLELFFPTDPTALLLGAVDADRLGAAAAEFPGGVVALVFMLFWAPVGPGIPAGVLLAVHAKLNPALTFGLYLLSDLLGACVCHPLYSAIRRRAQDVPMMQSAGRVLMKIALIGMRPPRVVDSQSRVGGTWRALLRIGTVGFGADIYAAGLLIVGMPVRRIPAWAAAIVGDLIWFSVLLATTLAAAQVTDHWAVQLGVMVVVMFLLPRVVERVFPASREQGVPTGVLIGNVAGGGSGSSGRASIGTVRSRGK